MAKKTKQSSDKAKHVGVFEMGSLVGVGLGLIGSSNQQWVEEDYLPKVVQKKLETVLPEILRKALGEYYLVAETYVLGESKQSRYFFAKLREVQSIKPTGFSNIIRNSTSGSVMFKRSISSA